MYQLASTPNPKNAVNLRNCVLEATLPNNQSNARGDRPNLPFSEHINDGRALSLKVHLRDVPTSLILPLKFSYIALSADDC